MRKVMICVSVMLAIVQFWPALFGHGLSPAQVAATAAPVARAATSIEASVAPVPAPQHIALVAAVRPALPTSGRVTCYRHYQIASAACAPADRACRINASDQWDLCEATGFWGN